VAGFLKKGDIVCLFGDLGSGKTTFTKGIAKGLKINQNKINSPTFVLVNEYQGRLPLYHLDLYRLDEIAEVCLIGYEEFLYGEGIAVVEWAEKLGTLMPENFLKVRFSSKGTNKRLINVTAQGKCFERVVKHLK